jgi:hypothetical protein
MMKYERRLYRGETNTALPDGIHLCTCVREGLGQGPHWWREVSRWPEDRREQWRERACIMELDGALSRDEAEVQAYRLVVDL